MLESLIQDETAGTMVDQLNGTEAGFVNEGLLLEILQ